MEQGCLASCASSSLESNPSGVHGNGSSVAVCTAGPLCFRLRPPVGCPCADDFAIRSAISGCED